MKLRNSMLSLVLATAACTDCAGRPTASGPTAAVPTAAATPSSTADETAPRATASASAPEDRAAGAAGDATAVLGFFGDHPPVSKELFAWFGRPCAELPADYHLPATLCDSQGRVAGMYLPVDYVHRSDTARVLVHEASPPGHRRGTDFSIWTAGPWLGIEQVTCGQCRRVMGVAFLGVPAWLDDAQRMQVQRRLAWPPADAAESEDMRVGGGFEVPKDRPLRSAAEWETALGTRGQSGSPGPR